MFALKAKAPDMEITQEPLYARLLSKTLGSSHVAFIYL